MTRSRYLSILTAAALVGAAPAWAQFDSSKGATKAPAATASKPLCSELGHPNAGKHADKSTGMAKEHSASPVHQDCIPDSQASQPGATTGATSANGGAMGASTSSTATTGVNANGTATASPSMTGSSTTQGSSITGSSTDTNSSVTGSNSTFGPAIDMRGRSSLTIDNATTTGNQSVDTTSTATTGNQSSTQSATSTTGDQSASGTASQSTTGTGTTSASGSSVEGKKRNKEGRAN